jgi:uncharacterized protein (TIGR02246 family)
MPMKSIVALLLALAVVSPSMAADLKDELLAMEKTSWKAWGDHDAKAFSALMTEDAVSISADGNVVIGRDKLSASVSSNTCKLNSFDFSDAKLRQPTADTAILTYTAKEDGSCPEGRLPPKLVATAIYVRQGGKWRWVNYQETPIK